MIQFPANLIPNYITVDKLPIAPMAILTPAAGLLSHTVGLSDQPQGGAMTMHFQTQPTIGRTADRYNPSTGDCQTIELGWADAWRFFSTTTKSGRLKFEIPATSALWKKIDYYPAWLDLSNGGRPSLWRMVLITNDNQVGDLRQLTKFKIGLKYEIRTPVWV